jgi:hypothetical protein
LHRAFRRTVERAREFSERNPTRVHDNAAAALLAHRWDKRFRGDDRCSHVEMHQLVEVVDLDLIERRGSDDANIVDESLHRQRPSDVGEGPLRC